MYRRKKISDEIKEKILEDYQKHEKSVQEIADHYNVSRGTIYYNLKFIRNVQHGGNYNVELIKLDGNKRAIDSEKVKNAKPKNIVSLTSYINKNKKEISHIYNI